MDLICNIYYKIAFLELLPYLLNIKCLAFSVQPRFLYEYCLCIWVEVIIVTLGKSTLSYSINVCVGPFAGILSHGSCLLLVITTRMCRSIQIQSYIHVTGTNIGEWPASGCFNIYGELYKLVFMVFSRIETTLFNSFLRTQMMAQHHIISNTNYAA